MLDSSTMSLGTANTVLDRWNALDAAGAATVLALRSKYGQPRKVLSDPAPYYDPSFYDAAIRR